MTPLSGKTWFAPSIFGTTQRPKFLEGLKLKKRIPAHNHFHCKNERSANRRKKRLLQEGWAGEIERGKSGFILTPTEWIPEEFRNMVM